MKHQRELAGIAVAVLVTAALPLFVAGARRTRRRCYRDTPEFQRIVAGWLV